MTSSGNKVSRGGQPRIQFRPPQKRARVQLRRGPSSINSNGVSVIRKGKGGSTTSESNGVVTPNASAQDDSFQLLPSPASIGKPFAMVIRLQPEILDELKQAEVEGREVSMKFGIKAGEHEIKVGADTFKFSSAPEPGDLCDIYEQKTGQNGESFLLEAGAVWRKLSVQRILSATEKDRVKQRTAEAEKKQRLRKAILVDSSTQKAISLTGASEGSRKLPSKVSKEPPPKKQRVSSPFLFQNDTHPSNGRPVPEKLPMLEKMITMPEKVNVPEKSFWPVVNMEPPQHKNKVQIATGRNKGKSGSAADMMVHLRDFLISLLHENPMGVSIKAVEKAVVDRLSGSMDKKVIEKVIKSIATYHAPGRYLLKPGIEKECIDASSGRVWLNACPITFTDAPSTIISHREIINKKKKSSALQESNVIPVTHNSPHSSPVEAFDPISGLLENDEKGDQGTLLNHHRIHEPKDISTDISDSHSSSESETRSDSGSDSDSSKSSSSSSSSGDESGSGSGSDSDSDGRSSESTDEEVDIISDDEPMTQKYKKHKLRRDVKTPISGKAPREKGLLTELAVLSCGDNGSKTCLAEASKSLMENVFGPDEEGVPSENWVTEEDRMVYSNNEERTKVLQLNKQSLGSSERLRLDIELAERPLSNVESTKEKDLIRNAVLKEANSLDGLKYAKQTENMEMACADSGRSVYHKKTTLLLENNKVISHDFEQGELREQSNVNDLRRSCSRTDDDRHHAYSEARSRALIQRRSSSPDFDDIRGQVRRPRRRSKHSYRDLDAPRQNTLDSQNTKKRIQENGKERSNTAQPPCNKQELSQASSKENGRLNSQDVQEHAINVSKNDIFENITRADEKQRESKGNAYIKPKLNRELASANQSSRDKCRAEYLVDLTSKQTAEIVRENRTEFFAPYEKQTANLRGPIQNYEEYKECCNEFRKKYPTYNQLHLDIDAYKKDFEIFRKDIEQVKHKDDGKKLSHMYGKVQNKYIIQRKLCKRMYHVFQVLHEELKTIKERCKEYAEKVGQG